MDAQQIVAGSRSLPLAFVAGAAVGVLGGMVGLGGAEFRLPLLIGLFGFAALQAVILNKAMSLVVVLTALPARLAAVPLTDLAPHWDVAANLLAGSLLGAWAGASWATRMRSTTLYRVLAVLLVVIAAGLLATHLGAAIVRGIEVYHVKSNGWNDIGYNFLVDKCGVVFEGRKGGIDRPVTGAHTYGFNTDTAAIAVLGTYITTGVPTVVEDAVAHVAAYKLGGYGNDPYGSVTLVSGVDGKYDLGESVVMNRISGHRDAVATECPGDSLYARLSPIRIKAATISGLALTGLTAGKSGSTYYARGSFTASWSVGTSSALIDRFEVLVDGKVAATTAGTARTAGVTVTPGAHTLQIRAVHRLGRTATTAAQAVVGDVTVPTFRKAPAISLRTGTVSTTGVPVSLGWQVTDNAALRASYLTAPSSLTFTPTTTSAKVSAKPGVTTAWSMRALDWAGNATTSSTSRTTVLTAETSATRSAGWSATASTSNLGGSALTSTTRNASLKWTFTGRSVAFIAKRTSASGQVAIYVDGVKVATVDLRSSSTTYRQAVWTRTWSTSGKHTVTAVVVGTSGRPRVTADGLAVVR